MAVGLEEIRLSLQTFVVRLLYVFMRPTLRTRPISALRRETIQLPRGASHQTQCLPGNCGSANYFVDAEIARRRRCPTTLD